MSGPYEPGLMNYAEDDLTALRIFLTEQFNAIADSMREPENVLLAVRHVVPDKPRNGMLVLADGTNWNPGSGAGFYGYSSGSWTFLG